MKTFKISLSLLVRRSILYYWRTNINVLAGVILCTTVLVGALVTGDSVRFSLKKITLARLGKIGYALVAGDRFFSLELAEKLTDSLGVIIAPAIQVPGITVNQKEQRRINQVQVLGVDETFWNLGGVSAPFGDSVGNHIAVNLALAKRLNVQKGDDILLRIKNVNAIPLDVPFAVQEQSNIAVPVKIVAVLTDQQFGRFNLQTSQTAPFNVFIPLKFLSGLIQQKNRGNLLLAENGSITESQLSYALKTCFGFQDAGLFWRRVDESTIDLLSDRIFIDPPIVDAVKRSKLFFRPILTYFANEMTFENSSSPFLFVTTGEQNALKKLPEDNEIIVNDWLARDLGVGIGSSVQMRYWIVGSTDKLQHGLHRFIVRDVVPMKDWHIDNSMVPPIPGLTDANHCREWEAGIPVDLDKIRDKDEKYWQQYGTTPKALVNPAVAKEMWANRFGSETAIRFLLQNLQQKDIEEKILQHLPPDSLGFVFLPVLQEGLAASRDSVDFGQLFLGLSFFIIIAAVLLTGLLFAFGLDHRGSQTGLLLAVGIPRKNITKLLIFEGAALSVIGGTLGVIFGVLYNKIVLYALGTVWRGAVGTSSMYLYIKPVSLLIGFLASTIVAAVALAFVVRKQVNAPISQTQRGQFAAEKTVHKSSKILSIIFLFAIGMAILIILITTSPQKGMQVAGLFFGLGFLYLTAVLLMANLFFIKSGDKQSTRPSVQNIGIRNNSRHRIKSLTTIGLLACGIFITIAVGANRTNSLKNAHLRSSGTGGFTLFAETVIPIPYHPNFSNGRQATGLADNQYDSVSFVPFRVREGDDASCLNLNRVTKPRILGVQPKDLSQRRVFTFAKTVPGVDKDNPWSALQTDIAPDIIPGVADMTVITWGFGKAVGDTLRFIDESGKTLNIKLVGGLANSIFQGNLIISNDHFIRHFPSISGYRLFLVDAGGLDDEKLLNTLSWNLQDYGIDITKTIEKLESFSIVTNTYLNIFLALGGLGLMIGTLGLGILVARNLVERRSELALLQAVGWSISLIYKVIFSEYGFILIMGLIAGVVAGILAVLPAIFLPGAKIPFGFIGIIIVFIFMNGLFWIFWAVKYSVRGELLDALRHE
ncbi:FtsX-like permease family protein [candidate division KSB1 bacterium]|nr:FtsX-like permease family protein [candidate division KSB1 bacterium]